MTPTDGSRSLAQRRILWWLAETGERPYWLGGRPSWEGGPAPSRCPLGLGRPFLPRPSVEAMIDEGLLVVEADAPGPGLDHSNVIVLRLPHRALLRVLSTSSRRAAQRGEPRLRLSLTEAGAAAAPAGPSYPWRPNVGGTSEMTFSEEERLRRIAAAAGRLAPPDPRPAVSGSIRDGGYPARRPVPRLRRPPVMI
jgi:hypothetical protein